MDPTDPIDQLILTEAVAVAEGAGLERPRVAVLDAPDLAAPAVRLGGPVSVHCDSLGAERTVPGEVAPSDDPATALAGAQLVLLRLPKSLAGLDEYCELIRAYADPTVRLVAGARIKHLRREMNEVLARNFGSVHASLGQRKARVLHAAELSDPGRPSTYPRRSTVELELPDGDRTLVLLDSGLLFAQGRVDAGTRLLLSTAGSWPSAENVIDLGCGDGILAMAAALLQPSAAVLAVDDSAAACRSATATAAANDVRVEVRRTDGLTGQLDRSTHLIVCNPPFHSGTAKDSSPAMAMLAEAARVLRPGGELWTVYNAHLPYLPVLRRVGRTTIAARDRRYLVTRTVVG